MPGDPLQVLGHDVLVGFRPGASRPRRERRRFADVALCGRTVNRPGVLEIPKPVGTKVEWALD